MLEIRVFFAMRCADEIEKKIKNASSRHWRLGRDAGKNLITASMTPMRFFGLQRC